MLLVVTVGPTQLGTSVVYAAGGNSVDRLGSGKNPGVASIGCGGSASGDGDGTDGLLLFVGPVSKETSPSIQVTPRV